MKIFTKHLTLQVRRDVCTKHDLREMEQRIMAKVSELKAMIDGVKAQVVKAKDEITDKIAKLEAALGDAELPPEAVTALEELKAVVQTVDDIVPDAPPVEPPPQP